MKVVQIPMNKADLFLRIIEAYHTLNPLRNLQRKNSLEITMIVLVDVNHLMRMHE